MKLILKILKPYKKILGFTLTLKALGAGVDLIIPWLISIIIGFVKMGNNSTKEIIIYSMVMILVSIIGLVFNIISNRRSEYISANAVMSLRNDLFNQILSLDASNVDKLSTPSIISRMTSDTYNIYQSTAGLQRIGVRAPILLLTGIIISIIISPIISLVILLLLPLIIFISLKISKKSIKLFNDVQLKQDDIIRVVRENINGARVVKALNTRDIESARFNVANEANYNSSLKATYAISITKPIMDIIMNVGLTLTILLGAILLKYDVFSVKVEMILTFVTNFTIILNAMLIITRIFTLISRAQASARRIEEILNTKNEIVSGADLVKENKDEFIRFNNVSFSYNKKINNLSDISFTLNKGESLGIVGPTGSGKTTLINLLMRFYDVDSGNILIYGNDLKNLNLRKWRKKVGISLQQDNVFSYTLKENITFERSIENEDDYNLALDVAQANFVLEEEKTLSQKGKNISGGQRQRLLLARSLVNKPELLILDDAASALDFETERKFRHSLEEKYPNITKIIISGRTSSVASCDKILVIEDGVISASGTHNELIKTSAFYKILYDASVGELS